ncbi:MAG: YicC family protein [Ignavibacteriaceae bacterium]|nr:YicC family protein [Ignavibacteriaceae bacterium]MCW8817457.1 YicC family protein [Ignavibacteriaceae bacterium]MCW8822789.1 YicC family protein [Ignavibacteriaceae bacterium]MCW9095198.1 YicC family protein [Ignavibacteriaceae bacterium]MCW9096366.1 YicC family protein [Ignavibacteriaceae bacterium]
MIYSMTGYGKGSSSKNKITAEVEIKSVNSRFFEVFLKMPSILSNYDYEIKEFIKSKLQRGKLNLVIHFKKDGVENGFSSVDKNKLLNQIELIKKVKKISGIKENIELNHLLNNKEIFTTQETELTKAEFEIIKSALSKALDKLILMKKKEGAELARDLNSRIEKINKKVFEIEKEFRKSINDNYEKLKQRISDLTSNAEISEDRLNLELALIADRADVTEECVRLKSHLKFFKESLKNESEPGKKLNFLCQEMNRETNTISSKSISTAIIHSSVYIKEEIEKIREQIQNIE